MPDSPASVAFSDDDEQSVSQSIAPDNVPATVPLASYEAKRGEYVEVSPTITVSLVCHNEKPLDIFLVDESSEFHTSGSVFSPDSQHVVGTWTSPPSGKRREMEHTQRGVLVARGDPDDPMYVFAPMAAKFDLKYTKAHVFDIMGDERASTCDKRDFKNPDLLAIAKDIDNRSVLKSSDLREAFKLIHDANNGYVFGTETTLALEKSVKQSARRKTAAKSSASAAVADDAAAPSSQGSASGGTKKRAAESAADRPPKRVATDEPDSASANAVETLFNDSKSQKTGAQRRKQSTPKRVGAQRRIKPDVCSVPIVVDNAETPTAATQTANSAQTGISFTLTATNVLPSVAGRIIGMLGPTNPE